jgi:hypothetical protein
LIKKYKRKWNRTKWKNTLKNMNYSN